MQPRPSAETDSVPSFRDIIRRFLGRSVPHGNGLSAGVEAASLSSTAPGEVYGRKERAKTMPEPDGVELIAAMESAYGMKLPDRYRRFVHEGEYAKYPKVDLIG